MPNDLQQKIAQARQLGMPEDIIAKKVQQYMQTLQQSSTQQSASQQGGMVQNFVSALVKPAVDYGKYVGEAGLQAAKFAVDPTFRKSVLGGQLTPEEAQQQLAAPMTGLLDENKLGTRGDIVKTGLKATAGASSYLVPAGGTLKAAVGLGALSGGLRSYSEDNSTLDSVAAGAAGGGIGGGLFYGATKLPGALQKLKAGVSNKARNTSKGIDSSIVNPKVAASPYGAGKEDDIVKGLSELGIKGPAKKQYAMLEPKMKEISGKISGVLEKSKQTFGVEDVAKTLSGKIDDNINAGDPAFEIAKGKILNKLSNISKEKDSLRGLDLFKFKQSLGDQLANAFKKLDKGGSLTPAEEAGMTAWKSIDGVLTQLEPSVKDFTTKQAILYQAAPGLKASANGKNYIPGLSTFGLKVNINNQVQTIKSALSGVIKGPNANTEITSILTPYIEKAGAGDVAAQRTISQLAQAAKLTGMEQTKALGSLFSQLKQTSLGGTIGGAVMNMQNSSTPYIDRSNPGVQPSPSQNGIKITKEQVAQAYLQLPKEEADKVAKYFELQGGNLKGTMSGANAKVSADAQSGLSALTQIRQELSSNSTAVLQSKIPGSPGARVYDQAAKEVADIIGRMRTGAVINDEEARFYLGKLPSPLDSRRTVEYKLATLEAFLKNLNDSVGGMDPNYQQ